MIPTLKNIKDIVANKEELMKILQEKGIDEKHPLFRRLAQVDVPNVEESVDKIKTRTLKRIDTWTANKITNGLVSDCVGYPVLYDSDRDTQGKLALALGLANAGMLQVRYPEGFPVRGYKQIATGVYEEEKTVHLFTAEAVIQWNAEFGEHLKKCTAEGWAKQAEVNACTTKEELESIVLE